MFGGKKNKNYIMITKENTKKTKKILERNVGGRENTYDTLMAI
jgi:hypothetical protein